MERVIIILTFNGYEQIMTFRSSNTLRHYLHKYISV